jgi:DNA polymerase elongation subunit (family B)
MLDRSLYITDKFNPRSLIKKEKQSIVINESDINLFNKPNYIYPDIEPFNKLEPYENNLIAYLDIETTGLVPWKDEVKMIGIKYSDGEYWFSYGHDEKRILKEFLHKLCHKKLYALITHNGFKFDFPFLEERFKQNNIIFPFIKADRERTVTSSSFHGKPIQYYPYRFLSNSLHLIDTLVQCCIWDLTFNRLESYGLKNAVIELGLRKERRTELSYQEMLACYRDNNWKLILEYLKFDLEDTELLANRIVKPYYYQMRWVPNVSFEYICVASPALKAQKQYEALVKNRNVISDSKLSFVGGISEVVNPGIYKNIAKIDVASLYPTLMLEYGLCSRKDKQMKMLGLLTKLKAERLRLKRLPDAGSQVEQEALKILINGLFGYHGVGFYTFNDMECAALITAYGRAVLRLMEKTINDTGTTVIECLSGDTKVITDKGTFTIESILNKKVNVLTVDRTFKPVTFTLRGMDYLYEVTLVRNGQTEKIKTNGKHRWYTKKWNDYYNGKGKKKWSLVKTRDLKLNSIIPCISSEKPEEDEDYNLGVFHGIVYGDGHINYNDLSKNGVRLNIALTGDKNNLADYILSNSVDIYVGVYEDKRRNDTLSYVFKTFNDYKKLPTGKSNSYLLGFVRGLISTDGSVCGKSGTVDISGKLETIEFIKSISDRIGFYYSRINLCNKKDRETIIKGKVCKSNQDTYKIFFQNWSIDIEDLLRPFHYQKFDKFQNANKAPWRVVSVAMVSNTIQPVYCCTESVTGTFVLDKGILTHNSDTDGIMYASDKPEAVYEAVQKALPKGIEIELEIKNACGYIPKAKNYIILYDKFNKHTQQEEEVLIKKGIYKKRNRIKLLNEFCVNLVRSFTSKGKESAKEYFLELKLKLKNKEIDKEQLFITRKISTAEKTLVNLGIGNVGDKVSFLYKSEDKIHKTTGKKLGVKYIPTVNYEEYDPQYYIDEISEFYYEIFPEDKKVKKSLYVSF